MSQIMGVLQILEGIFGAQRLINLWETNTPLAVFLTASIALTLVWAMLMWGGKTAAMLGKFPGSFAVSGIVIAVGTGLMVGMVTLAVNLGVGAIVGGLRAFTVFDYHVLDWAADIVQDVADSLVPLVVGVGIGIFILKSIHTVAKQLWDAFVGTAKAWSDEKAPNGVKLYYQLAGCLVVAVPLCNSEWTEGLYYIPAGVSAAFGIFSLFWATKPGQKIIRRRLQVDPETGDWICDNIAEEIREQAPGVWITVPGRFVRCKGPEEGGGRNPKTATHCGSVFCDKQSPWLFCDCGKGKAPEGILRKDPSKPIRCAECGKTHPGIPKSVPFHAPGEDRHHSGNVSPPLGSAHQAENSPPAVEDIEIALDVPTVKCTACGEQTPKGFSCEQCGQPLDAEVRRFRAESESGW